MEERFVIESKPAYLDVWQAIQLDIGTIEEARAIADALRADYKRQADDESDRTRLRDEKGAAIGGPPAQPPREVRIVHITREIVK